MSDAERALTAVLTSEQERYVHLLNSYLALLAELAALRAELDRLRAGDAVAASVSAEEG